MGLRISWFRVLAGWLSDFASSRSRTTAVSPGPVHQIQSAGMILPGNLTNPNQPYLMAGYIERG